MTVEIPKVGDRVRHAGEQYPEAIRSGTATVIEVIPPRGNRDVSWTEIVVQRDKPLWGDMNTRTQWALMATIPVQPWT